MSVGGQFTGLDMKELIGGPLSAAADASVQLAQSTAEFINNIGFDSDNKVRTVGFGYTKKSDNIDGSHNNDEMNVDVPLLAIVPIPNLQVDEVNILFDMEVKESERSESSKDIGATFSGTLNLGIIKATVSGSVATHESNTRSSDNSAKYHVDVRASNHGTPEGLARVLDMMAACVAPETLSSTIVGDDGKELAGARKERAQKLKMLQAEIIQMNQKVEAANNSLGLAITRIKKQVMTSQNQYTMRYSQLIEASQDNEEQMNMYKQKQSDFGLQWNDFNNNIQDKVELLASLNVEDESTYNQYIKLPGITSEGEDEDGLTSLTMVIKAAVKADLVVIDLNSQLQAKQDEYNKTMYGD